MNTKVKTILQQLLQSPRRFPVELALGVVFFIIAVWDSETHVWNEKTAEYESAVNGDILWFFVPLMALTFWLHRVNRWAYYASFFLFLPLMMDLWFRFHLCPGGDSAHHRQQTVRQPLVCSPCPARSHTDVLRTAHFRHPLYGCLDHHILILLYLRHRRTQAFLRAYRSRYSGLSSISSSPQPSSSIPSSSIPIS